MKYWNLIWFGIGIYLLIIITLLVFHPTSNNEVITFWIPVVGVAITIVLSALGVYLTSKTYEIQLQLDTEYGQALTDIRSSIGWKSVIDAMEHSTEDWSYEILEIGLASGNREKSIYSSIALSRKSNYLNTDVLDTLEKGLYHSDESIMKDAAKCLGNYKSVAAAADILKQYLVENDAIDKSRKITVLEALGNTQYSGATTFILDFISRNSKTDLVSAAVVALAKCGGESVVDSIVSIFRQKAGTNIHLTCVYALGEIIYTDEAFKELFRILNDFSITGHQIIHGNIISIVGNRGNNIHKELLQALLRNPDYRNHFETIRQSISLIERRTQR